MTEELLKVYLQYGALGGSVIGLSIAVLLLWRRNDALTAELKASNTGRLADLTAAQATIASHTAILRSIAATVKRRTEMAEVISQMQPEISTQLVTIRGQLDLSAADRGQFTRDISQVIAKLDAIAAIVRATSA